MNTKFSDLTLTGKLLLIPAFVIIIAVAWFGSAMVYWLFPDIVNLRLMAAALLPLGWVCFALSSKLEKASKLRVLHPQAVPDPNAAERTPEIRKMPGKVRVSIDLDFKNRVCQLTGLSPNIPDGLTSIELLNLLVLMARRANGSFLRPMKAFDLSSLDSILDEMETECPRWRHAPGYPDPPDNKPKMSADELFGYDRLINGRYSLIRTIGCDADSIVWLGKAIDSNIRKAIKITSRRAESDETKDECRSLEIMTQHKHPYLLRTDDFFAEEGRLIVIMEFANGGNLAKATGGGLPVEKLLVYMSHIAAAVDYLQEKGVLHRDVQPSNIFVVGRKAKLAAPRFAILAAEATKSNVSGVPLYMAPEVLADGIGDAKSDLYSLAVTYAELRLGRKVFDGQSNKEIIIAQFTQMPDLSPLPKVEQQVLLRALAKRPADRFATGSEFIKALEVAVAQDRLTAS
jgi:Protein kinase domain